MNILEDLWLGKILPHEQYTRNDEAYYGALRALGAEQERLLAGLSPEVQTVLEQLVSAMGESAVMAERDAFILGFRLAIQMVLDSLRDR